MRAETSSKYQEVPGDAAAKGGALALGVLARTPREELALMMKIYGGYMPRPPRLSRMRPARRGWGGRPGGRPRGWRVVRARSPALLPSLLPALSTPLGPARPSRPISSGKPGGLTAGKELSGREVTAW